MDCTCSDEEIPTRGQQIRHWLNYNGGDRKYAVLDDGGVEYGTWSDLGIQEAGHPVLWINWNIGLTQRDANDVIEYLNEKDEVL